jgi:DNA-binding response OmpR family regulator
MAILARDFSFLVSDLSQDQAMTRPSILVVDDSSTIRLQLQRILSRAGYRVVTAANGKEGLRKAQDECPQLVILDIQMPELDGYTVCQELKRTGYPWDKLPIIFLTSLQSHALSLLGSEMGAYLRKPVCPAALLRTVARFVGPGPAAGDELAVAGAAARDGHGEGGLTA